MLKRHPAFHFRTGHLDAKSYWNTILEASPDDFVAYAALGRNDEALASLEKAYGSQGLARWGLRHPMLSSLRSEPRYLTLMKKMDLPPSVVGSLREIGGEVDPDQRTTFLDSQCGDDPVFLGSGIALGYASDATFMAVRGGSGHSAFPANARR